MRYIFIFWAIVSVATRYTQKNLIVFRSFAFLLSFNPNAPGMGMGEKTSRIYANHMNKSSWLEKMKKV